MRALLAQVDAPETPEQGVERVRVTAGSDPDLDLVAFPELYLTGYNLDAGAERALELEGDEIAGLTSAAAESETALAVGFAERRGSAIANSLALIDETGELVGVYRKTHLFGREKEAFAPGDGLIVTTLGGVRVGSLICFDMEFCETARALARAGAELLLTVSANMHPFYDDHLIASQARALDNRLPHLYVNRCGRQGGMRFVGGSRALRSDGSIAAGAGESEELLTVDIPASRHTDDRVDYLAQIREHLPVTEPTSTGGTSK